MLAWGVLLLSTLGLVAANTEIVNFAVSPGPDLVVPESHAWPALRPGHANIPLQVQPAALGTSPAEVCPRTSNNITEPCPHEAWLSLKLDEDPWDKYDKFTLRISWPTSSPADFFIRIFSPAQLVEPTAGRKAERTTRVKFARIRVVDTGVLTPSRSDSPQNTTADPVAFMVILEPLWFGVLPESLIPTLLFLIPVLGIAGFIVLPRVQKWIQLVAEQAKEEIAQAEEKGGGKPKEE